MSVFFCNFAITHSKGKNVLHIAIPSMNAEQ